MPSKSSDIAVSSVRRSARPETNASRPLCPDPASPRRPPHRTRVSTRTCMDPPARPLPVPTRYSARASWDKRGTRKVLWGLDKGVACLSPAQGRPHSARCCGDFLSPACPHNICGVTPGRCASGALRTRATEPDSLPRGSGLMRTAISPSEPDSLPRGSGLMRAAISPSDRCSQF